MAVAQGTCVVMQVCTMMKRALCLFVSLHFRRHRLHLMETVTSSHPRAGGLFGHEGGAQEVSRA